MPTKKTNAEILYYKLYPIKKESQKIKISLVNAFNLFHKELNDLNYEFNKKSYTDEYIISFLYNNKTIPVKSYSLFCRLNLLVCVQCFNSLVDKRIKKDNIITTKEILNYKIIIKDYIFDLIPFVTFLKRKKDKNYRFLNGGKNNTLHTFEIYNNAYWLQFSSAIKENFLDQKISYNLSLFTLRQAIELRFRQSIGIGEIYDNLDENPKLRHDFFPNFIIANKDIIKVPYDNLKYLMHIYKWTNYFIHYGISPRVWDTNFALKYSENLFIPAEFITKSRKKIWSISGNIIIDDLEELKIRFCKYLNLNNRSGIMYCIDFIKPDSIINE